MIPDRYASGPCYGESNTDPKERAKHKGHKSGVECYLLTWDEPPLPWVQRQVLGRVAWMKTWHLAIGTRKDNGIVQVDCNVGSGPGPFRWREVPTLRWQRRARAMVLPPMCG